MGAFSTTVGVFSVGEDHCKEGLPGISRRVFRFLVVRSPVGVFSVGKVHCGRVFSG